MNIVQMKCVVEIAKEGSINKASEALLIAQPNLSKTLKELEEELGVKLFSRSSRGMQVTPEGEEFIGYAKNILKQLDELEQLYKDGASPKRRFAVSAPRASYVSEAFALFSNQFSYASNELIYNETNSVRTIENVLTYDYNLGIIRYSENFEKYFDKMLNDKGLSSVPLTRFRYVLVMSKNSSLAQKEIVRFADLENFTEIAHADPYVPSLPISVVRKQELPDSSDKTIYVYERGSQFDLLSLNHNTFMWVSPIPKRVLDNCGLTQRDCPENERVYKDVLIYRKNYRLNDIDRSFINELKNQIALF